MNIIFSGVLVLLVFEFVFGLAPDSPQSDSPVTRKTFDFIVSVDGDFKKSSGGCIKCGRFRRAVLPVFPDGEYDIGTLTGDDNTDVYHIHLKHLVYRQSADKTIIFNKSIQEGISITATLYLKSANNTVFAGSHDSEQGGI
jgi:hypothetical protein